MNRTLTAIRFDGLNTDSLGNYLAGVGLLVALAQRWRNIRGCWSNGRFIMLAENGISPHAVSSFLMTDWKPAIYERWWTAAQKTDTKARSSTSIWRERSHRSIVEVQQLDAHIVGLGRNCFNPVLGTGGNIGKRDLAKACKDAARLLSREKNQDWLNATLTGRSEAVMPDLSNGGTWFVFANKTFNSGQSWYREGQLSPWSLLLAMEGALLLVGGVNRRMGSRARPYAVFPFVSEASQPESDGEIGLARAEFWAPLWKFPATILEIRALFRRGLAKLGGRAAKAPHEFAIAALSSGFDAGISEFARFELRQTTSSQVYEAIPRERIAVRPRVDSARPLQSAVEVSAHDLLMSLFDSGWLDRLPYEPRDSKQKGKFVGLRGPVESAIIRIGEQPNDPERWQNLLLRLATALARIDRSKLLRERCIAIPPLSQDWFRRAWPSPTPEVEIARAIASIGWSSRSKKVLPLIGNVFGVEPILSKKGWNLRLPKNRPAQAVWGAGDPLQVLLDITHRRLVDADDSDDTPFVGSRCCAADLVQHFLLADGNMNLEEIHKWIPALSLIDWSSLDTGSASYSRQHVHSKSAAEGTALLHALVRPMFHCDRRNKLLLENGRSLFHDDQLPKAGLLRRLFQLLRFGSLDQATQVLRDRYLALGRSIVMPPSDVSANGERIAAALLIPMTGADVVSGLRRWLQPIKVT